MSCVDWFFYFTDLFTKAKIDFQGDCSYDLSSFRTKLWVLQTILVSLKPLNILKNTFYENLPKLIERKSMMEFLFAVCWLVVLLKKSLHHWSFSDKCQMSQCICFLLLHLEVKFSVTKSWFLSLTTYIKLTI